MYYINIVSKDLIIPIKGKFKKRKKAIKYAKDMLSDICKYILINYINIIDHKNIIYEQYRIHYL